jgi:cell division protein YceG involved in septum cleavage
MGEGSVVRLSRGSKWFLAFFMLLVAAGAAGVYWLDTNVFREDFEAGVPVEYEVGRGQTLRSVGDELAELNVISSSVRFRLAADEQGLATGLQPGLFEFETGMEIEEAIAVLAAGPLTRHRSVSPCRRA